ncbi:MAG: hypothetical protein ACJ744_16525 [Gaiellaceae bacterium]
MDSVEERGVALDLDELELGGRVHDRLEQAAGDVLGVSEIHPVQPHEPCVATDVCEDEQRTIAG